METTKQQPQTDLSFPCPYCGGLGQGEETTLHISLSDVSVIECGECDSRIGVEDLEDLVNRIEAAAKLLKRLQG